ncbi:hypothetical protein, partial [Actinoplanes rectilineatus]|uniref:hypothetical protein n=1 Tax=Actinoplanes rectilineatus TaxID=113571 RepID=UPI0012FC2F2D
MPAKGDGIRTSEAPATLPPPVHARIRELRARLPKDADGWHAAARKPDPAELAALRAAADAADAAEDQPLDQRTRERHAAVHRLLEQGHGLLECARRLG